MNFVVLLTYYLDLFVAEWNGRVAAVSILLICPLMISGYKSYNAVVGHALAGLFCTGATGISLGLELANAGVI